MRANFITKLSNFFVDYFSFSGQLVSQAEAESNIRDGVTFRGTNIVILILAIFIASLGLNTNSTAVIIGAMLISPLMGPIIGIGLGVGIHDFDLLKRCVRNLVMAAGFSVIASTLYFLISPVNEQHSELLARTSPTIYDVLIGFFGGAAGIMGLGSRNKGNVIPGVAIATALMPPLCTAGYGLATWQLNYFFGASYLFIINSIYIAFATFIGVKLMNYKGVQDADNARALKVRRIVYTLAILTMLPSIYLTYRMLSDNRFTMDSERFVQAECNFPETQVINRRAYVDHGQKYLSLTLIGQPMPIDSLRLALTPRLKFYGLEGTKLIFIQGSSATSTPSAGTYSSDVADIYRIAQATITRQQSTIDSLHSLVAAGRQSVLAAPEVSPELSVVFPKVERIGISTTVFTTPGDNARTDTATVAMIRTKGHFSGSERKRLAEYLQARLGYSKVTVVEM
ncbi:MAG: TIGR00341 family protein [Muribaculaceae bacterium]|nr:TIGR00341 family protein [Muribaculaceae bacterium]